MSTRIAVMGLLALAALSRPAGADSTFHAVQVRHADCTKKPPPRSIRLRSRTSKPQTIRLDVLGPAKLCGNFWRGARAGHRIDLTVSAPSTQSACTSCAAIIEIGDVPAGSYTVVREGARTSAHSRRPPRPPRSRHRR